MVPMILDAEFKDRIFDLTRRSLEALAEGDAKFDRSGGSNIVELDVATAPKNGKAVVH